MPTAGSKSDHCTEHFRASADQFISTRDPESLAERLRAERVDILVDLSGHTMGPAYLAFALLPPQGSEHLFSETVYRMPRAFCCYRPFADVPAAPTPCLGHGHVTFGCFNNPQKITRDVVRLWSC